MSLRMSFAGYIFQVKQPNLREVNGLQRILRLGGRKVPSNHPKQQTKHKTLIAELLEVTRTAYCCGNDPV